MSAGLAVSELGSVVLPRLVPVGETCSSEIETRHQQWNCQHLVCHDMEVVLGRYENSARTRFISKGALDIPARQRAKLSQWNSIRIRVHR